MRLAILLTSKNSNEVCKYFMNYIFDFINKKISVILFCESEFDYNFFIKNSNNKFKIYYIFSNSYFLDFPKPKIIKNNKKIFNIDKNLLKYDSVLDIDKYLEFFFDNTLFNTQTKFGSINFADGTFNSYSAVFFDNYCNRKNIKFLFPFPTPANGRFIIYDSIFLNSKKFNLEYQKQLLATNNSILEEVHAYINKYLLYEKDHKYRKKRFKRNINLINKLKIKLKIFLRRRFTKYKKIIYRKLNKPYILYMLTKTDSHWFTNYANPELSNRIDNIKQLLSCIPENYNLILKFHPRISIDYEIEDLAIKYDNLLLAYEKKNINISYELIKNAEIIIGYGTTSLMHPLYQYKKIIDVGINSTYYNFDNPPVKRINNFKMISKKLINDYINRKIDKNKIYAYFYSLLKCSNLFYEDSNEILDEKPIEQKRIIADKMIEIIKSANYSSE